MGIYLYELEKITEESINTPLTHEEKNHNRVVLLEKFNINMQHMKIYEIFSDYSNNLASPKN